MVEYIRYTLADQARGDVLQRAYATATKQLDAAPECLAYELTQARRIRSPAEIACPTISIRHHASGG